MTKKYVTKTFPKKKLRELLGEEGVTLDDGSELETISDEQFDTTRWSIVSVHIFKHTSIADNTEKFYSVNYSVGATELQDERPFEYEGDDIVCYEVEPREVMTTQYFPIEVKE